MKEFRRRRKQTAGRYLLSGILMLCMAVFLMSQMVSAEGGTGTVTLTPLDGTDGASENEGYDKLIDGKKTEEEHSKWCVTDLPGDGAYIVFEASDVIKVTGYTFTTGNDNDLENGRNPKDWTLYGCNNYTGKGTGTWEAIHTVTDDTSMQDKNYTDYNFTVSDAGYYKYYKLCITAVRSGSTMQLEELALSYSTCNHDWSEETTVSKAACYTPKYVKKTCTGDCGVTVTYAVGSALGHNIVNDHCTRCDKDTVAVVGAFNVSGAVKDVDYTYDNQVLTILTGIPVTIQNTDPDTATTDKIVVAKDVSADITLAGVNIDVSSDNYRCAFQIADDSRGKVKLTL